MPIQERLVKEFHRDVQLDLNELMLGERLGDDCAHALRASQGGGDKPHVLAFHQNQRAEVTMNETCGALNKGGGKPGQGYPAVAFTRQEYETLLWQGINQGGRDACPQETNTREILRALRQEVGEEAFTEWGLGILVSFYSQEILQSAVHGKGVRCPSIEEFGLVNYALSCEETGSERAVLYLREAQCKRCASFGWEPHEQRSRELAAYLSKLSHPGTSGEKVLRDLWSASQCEGILRQTLSAVQKMGRPAHREGQPAFSMQVRRLVCEEAEFLQGFPRNYTRIPWRGKPASECPDGPRYKALGNSMAVPCMAWIGKRIMMHHNT